MLRGRELSQGEVLMWADLHAEGAETVWLKVFIKLKYPLNLHITVQVQKLG